MNENTAIANQSSRRPLWDTPTPSHISVWRRARRFAHFAFVPLLAVLLSTTALAQTIHVAGQLLIDLNATRGLTTNMGMSTNAGETNVIAWANYGILGGEFDAPLTSVYASTITTTNPPALTNFAGVYAPSSPGGGALMVASFPTPAQLQGHVTYSVECWFYENAFVADPNGVFGWTLVTPPAGDAGIFSGDVTAADHANGNSLNWNAAGTAVSLTNWHYGVLAYDGTTESVYLDGILTNSKPVNLNLVATNAAGTTGNPTIFSYLLAIPDTGASGRFSGAIASLRVHTDALSAADVANNFAAGLSSVPPPVNLSVQINPVTAISGTPGTPNSGTATLNALLQATLSPSTTVVTFFYDTTDHGRTTNGWAHSVTVPAPHSVGPVSANITGLTFGTLYYVRAYTTDSADTNLSASVSFNSVGAPGIQNSSAFFAGPGLDNLGGNLTLDGDGSGQAFIILYWGPANGGSVAANWANSVNLGGMPIGAVNYSVGGLATQGNYFFTYAATNAYGATWATPSRAFQEGLLFSLNTTNLPAATLPPAAPAPVTSYASPAGTFIVAAANSATGIPVVQDFGGVPWLATTSTPADNLRLPTTLFPGGAPTFIPTTGGTVVAAVRPTAAGSTSGWSDIVSVYFSQLGLALSPTTATAPGGSVASVTVTNGGSNYTTAPSVTIAAPGGTPALDSTATATALISSAGVVTNVTVTSSGSGYAPFTGTAVGDIPPPTVSFSGGGGSGAAATAVMNTYPGAPRIFAEVNTSTPNTFPGTAAYIPLNQVSIVSSVAGSGATSGTPGDNNYMIYVNGVKVLDSDWGYITGVSFTGGTNGFGYTNPPTVTFSPPTAPGGTTATGVAVLGTGANAGHVTSVTITSPGSGYTGNGTSTAGNNVTVTFSAPPSGGTQATAIATGVNLGLYRAVTGVFGAPTTGYNAGNMTSLKFNAETYSPQGTFCIGQDDYTIDPWSGFPGYIGDVYVYGEAIPDATRQALEAQLAAKFVTSATLSFTVTSSVASGSGTITAPGQNGSGVTTVVQGNALTYTISPTAGSAISGVTVDGVSVGIVSSYTLSNISANHTIAASFVIVPPQTITSSVTGGTGGTISPLGLVNVPGGGTQFFSIQPSNGFVLSALVVDATNIANPLGTTVLNATVGGPNPGYTFVNLGGNGSGPAHTIAVTFAALPGAIGPSVPQSDQILFSVETASLPTTNNAPITNWPVYAPSTLAPMIVHFTQANTFLDSNNVIWEKNVETEVAGQNTAYQLGATTTTKQPTVPVSGFTIICAASPIRGGTAEAWNDIVDVYFGCATIGIRDDTGNIQVLVNGNGGINNNYDTGYSVPSGANVVLSLVIQPTGAFAIYDNTIMVYTNAGTGPFTNLVPGIAGTYANNIDIGDEQPDNWAGFNGLIGDVFVYTTALSPSNRNNLEAALMTKFHAVVPPNYNWNGTNNANWSSVTSWTNTVPLAVNTVPGAGATPVFSVTSTAGQTVQVDQFGITVAGLAFNSNAVNTVIASKSGNALTLDSGAKATSASISVSAGSSPTISNALNVMEGLNTTGAGTLSLAGAVSTGAGGTGYGGHLNAYGNLNLSGNVNVGGGTVVAYLRVARDTSSTAVLTQKAGTVTTFSIGEDVTGGGNGPGVGLGGYDRSATHATYNLNGGTLIIPNIGSVANTNGVLVPPGTFGGSAILNLNGGVLQPSGNDLASTDDAAAVTEGSAHLIFNTTHTWVQAGGAIFNTGGFSNSIAVPLEHYPSGPDIDGGLTVMGAGGAIALLSSATYTGPTKVASGTLICMATNSIGGTSLDIEDGAVVNLNFTGTTPVYQLTLNAGSPLAAGTYGATGSGAANIDNLHFAGAGTVTVLGSVTVAVAPKFTGTGFTGGNLVLQGTGGRPGGSFLIMGSTNVAATLTNWVTLGVGTFTGAGFSVSIPVSNTVPQEFIQLVIP